MKNELFKFLIFSIILNFLQINLVSGFLITFAVVICTQAMRILLAFLELKGNSSNSTFYLPVLRR